MPLLSQNMKTNIGMKFLKLITKHFPKGSSLHKLSNKNNIKVSFSCTRNIASLIKGHNTAVLKPQAQDKLCNCRVKTDSSLKGKCRATNLVYEATVITGNTTKKYIYDRQ